MRISIALAVRNGEQYLGELLDGLARQTVLPHELVVWDDASDDSTPALLERFAATAPFPVHVERGRERLGHVEAFLHAARRCSGDAIAFCDHDDVWVEHKLARAAWELERADATLLLHAARLIDGNGRDLGRTWPAIERDRVLPPLGLIGLATDAPGMAMVFRRSLLDVADFAGRPGSRYGNGNRMLHDEWSLFLAGAIGRIVLLAEPLVRYRQHEANDSGGWVDRRRRLTLRPAVRDYRVAAEHTAACADYLEQTSSRDPRLAERLTTAARVYRETSRQWALRLSLYGAADRRTRAALLRRLVAMRGYRERSAGGFGRAALAKDVVAGLVLRIRPREDERAPLTGTS
jgi:glycosyltransferase involved in cell wall biosynthesis